MLNKMNETWFHWLKWRLICFFGLYEFKVTCVCGNKIRATDGVVEYEYVCSACDKVYCGTKRVFT